MYILIIIALAFVIILTIFIIFKARKRKYTSFIIKNSVSIDKIIEVNGRYDFEKVNDKYMEHSYDNDISFEKISCIDYLIYQLQYERKDFGKEIIKANRNKDKFDAYLEEVKRIDSFGQFNEPIEGMNINYLCGLEKKLFEDIILLPKRYFYVFIRLNHTNINGRILETKEQKIDSSKVIELIKRLNDKNGTFYNDREIWDSICLVERGKVSNKMRFSIYERDGYRCRYCGRSGKFYDLEIDHIKPISKGGKSTYDNLQTLCRRCNKEKGDKY